MRKVEYLADWFAAGALLYQAGKTYPVSEEAEAHVRQGVAKFVEVDEREPLTDEVLDRAAQGIVNGEHDLAYAVGGISSHYKVARKTVQASLETRVEALNTAKAEADAKAKEEADAAKAKEEADAKAKQEADGKGDAK
jgi:hypothetical protein